MELVLGCKLKDVAARKKLWEGGAKAVAAAGDPMIALAKAIDPEARKLRKALESDVTEVKQQAYAQIAKAKYAVEGSSTYPDATFTLRLAFGTVKGYEEDGKKIPAATDFAGLYERAKEHHNKVAVRPARALGGPQEPAGSENAVQLRLHRGHHRRQLRQPGDQPRRGGGRASSSTATSSRWCSTSSTRMTWPGRCRCIPPASSRR